MRLFRGMAVPSAAADGVVDELRRHGVGLGRSWKMVWPGASTRVPVDAGAGDAIEELAVCACGDFDGAAYYACRHNRSDEDDTPIVVEFACALDAVAVDGRDLLYTLFQGGSGARVRDVVERAFGRRAVAYLDEAWRTADQQRRIALCRDATVDPEVVRAHAENELVLGGRHGTVFRSAFLARLPIGAGSVLGIHRPDAGFAIPRPVAVVGDLVGRRRGR